MSRDGVAGYLLKGANQAEIVRGLRMLRTKRETLPPKKHGNIPL